MKLYNELLSRFGIARDDEEKLLNVGGNEYYYKQGYADAIGEIIELMDANNLDTDIFDNLKKYREDRNLHLNSFDMETYLRKVYEEDYESQGFDSDFCKVNATRRAVFETSDMFIKEIYGEDKPLYDSDICKVDAFADGIVFRIEAIEQLGFDARKVMDEVQKEINSRLGEIVNGKFEKYIDDYHKSLWYKADLESCRR